MFLVVIDAHSKWIEVSPMATATSSTTIQQLRQMFARFGLPDTVVSDNGPQFASSEFAEFCHANGIRHILVAPCHPASNGLAERAVRILKQGLRKMTEGSLSNKLARFLFHYRNTPHSTTGMIPAELLMGRKLRSRLDLVKPNLQQYARDKQEHQRWQHDLHATQRTFGEGEEVFVKNHRAGDPWLPGEIIKVTGPVSYMVKMADGNVVRSHQDHLRSRYAGGQASQSQPTEDVDDSDSHITEDPGQPDRDTPSPDSAFEITAPHESIRRPLSPMKLPLRQRHPHKLSRLHLPHCLAPTVTCQLILSLRHPLCLSATGDSSLCQGESIRRENVVHQTTMGKLDCSLNFQLAALSQCGSVC